ncbi:hypothetical protein Q0M94_08580 [Deinococcus radiomollis]|uniref:hypothetical protein n=1 Tax=Deinococcus radiomollis TaxID=468916 RepID=UPI0038919AD5
MPEDTRSGSGTQGHQQADTEAQQHPEGNVPDRVESPEVGLPVDDGQPSGEENGEQQQDWKRPTDRPGPSSHGRAGPEQLRCA